MASRAPPYWDSVHSEPCGTCGAYIKMIVEKEQARPGRRKRFRRTGIEKQSAPTKVTQASVRKHLCTNRHIERYLCLEDDYLAEGNEWLQKNSLYDIQKIAITRRENSINNEGTNGLITLNEENMMNNLTECGGEIENYESPVDNNIAMEYTEEMTQIEEQGNSNANYYHPVKAFNTKKIININLDDVNKSFNIFVEDNEWFPFEDENTCRMFLSIFYVLEDQSESEMIKSFSSHKALLMANNAAFNHSYYSLKKFLEIIPKPGLKTHTYTDENQETQIYTVISILDIITMSCWNHNIVKKIKSNAESNGIISDVETGEKWKTTREMQAPRIFVKNLDLWQGNLYKITRKNNPISMHIVFHTFQINKLDESINIFYVPVISQNGQMYVKSINEEEILCISSKEIEKIEKISDNLLCGIFEDGNLLPSNDIPNNKSWIIKKSIWENLPESSLPFKIFNVIFWTDGVKISKHKAVEAFSIELMGLPRVGDVLRRKPIHIGVALKSKGGSAVKTLLKSIISEIKELERGFISYDAGSNKKAIIKGTIGFTKGDNPIQNEIASFPTGCKLYCRVCYYKASLNSTFHPTAKLRSSDEVRKLYLIRKQTEISNSTSNLNRKLWASRSNLSQQESPFLELSSFNGAVDTPTDVLHTLFLGVVKYLASQALHAKEKSEQIIFAAKLDASDYTYLPVRLTKVKYKSMGSFVAKEMHALLSVAPFVYYNEFPEAAIAFSELAWLIKMIHQPEIKNMDLYTTELQEQIDITINVINRWSPSILSNKPKCHLLFHFPAWIKRHGACLGYSTELNESSNILLKKQVHNTNFSALSKDVAVKIANKLGIEHLISGSCFPWEGSKGLGFYRAGSGVLKVAEQYKKIKLVNESNSKRGDRMQNLSFVMGSDNLVYYINDTTYNLRDSSTDVKVLEFIKTDELFRHGVVLRLTSQDLKTISSSVFVNPINVEETSFTKNVVTADSCHRNLSIITE